MFTSAIVDLRLQAIWEPARLTAEAFRWPVAGDVALVPVRDLVMRLSAKSFADAGAPVISLGDIDANTGGVRHRSRRYQGAVYQVGAELRAGDVVVPRTGLGPALLIAENQRGALLSARFSAFRPLETELGLWLWAAISSESGRRMRANISLGSAIPSVEPTALLDAPIPLPPLERLQRVSDELQAIYASTFIEEDEPVETWWTVADLRTSNWRSALATPDPSILTAGEPLGDYCLEILRGRPTRALAADQAAPRYLPVADVSMLGGKPPRRWVPEGEGNPRIAGPGDLLVAGLGKLSHAWVADRPVVVDSHVLLLSLRDPQHGPALARYLNGQAAFEIRQLFLSGSAIPHLSARDLGRFPVPSSAFEEAEDPILTTPLAERLERVLWQD